MKLFPSSLTRSAFTWFINLPHNSVNTWQELEDLFNAQFFRTEPEVSMADLAKLKQKPSETTEQFKQDSRQQDIDAMFICQKLLSHTFKR